MLCTYSHIKFGGYVVEYKVLIFLYHKDKVGDKFVPSSSSSDFMSGPNFQRWRPRNSEIIPIEYLRHKQSGILEGFSKVLPNSYFKNGGIKRNWPKIFNILFAISMKYW